MSYNGAARFKPFDWVYGRNGEYLYYHVNGPQTVYDGKDGYNWHRVNVSYEFGYWLESQDATLWRYVDTDDTKVIIREDFMTLIHLRWV